MNFGRVTKIFAVGAVIGAIAGIFCSSKEQAPNAPVVKQTDTVATAQPPIAQAPIAQTAASPAPVAPPKSAAPVKPVTPLPGRARGAMQMVTTPLAPDFTLKDLNGNDVTLSQQRGSVVFLGFWAVG